MNIGLEKEFFLVDHDSKVQVLTGDLAILPHDNCGWLVEARGEAFDTITKAVYSLEADCYEIRRLLKKKINVAHELFSLVDTPIMPLIRATTVEASRHFAKGISRHGNFYGYTHHRNNQSEATAGLHISFTSGRTQLSGCKCGQSYNVSYNGNFDWPAIFVGLDKEFAEEIREAKRRPGFYEIKHDGRVEYRSLPSNIDTYKLIEVVKELLIRAQTSNAHHFDMLD